MSIAGRIWLVDDNADFRESAGWWLEGLGFEVRAFDGPLAFQEAALEDALAQAFASAPEGEAADAADPAYADRVAKLTPREREVMDLVVDGHPNKVAAFRLGISPKTVELHRSRVMAKMEARSLTHLVRMSLNRTVHAD